MKLPARANVDDLEASVLMDMFDRRNEEVVFPATAGHELLKVSWFQVTHKYATLSAFDERDVGVRTDASALASLAIV